MALRIAVINKTGGGMSGGYRAYLSHVLPRLAAHPRVDAVLCATPSSIDCAALCAAPLPRTTFVSCAPFRLFSRSEDVACTAALRDFAPHVVFVPIQRPIHDFGAPVVSMLQNMAPLISAAWENPWSERVRYAAQRFAIRQSLRESAHIVVPSTFVKSALVAEWGIPFERVSVIHYGAPRASELLRSMQKPAIPDAWDGSFIFTAGSVEPYRGLEDLVHALHLLRQRQMRLPLAVAGVSRPNMRAYIRHLTHRIAQCGLTEQVVMLGALTQEEMAWCYTHCNAFVMTSRVETFAVIGVEALRAGCISIVANNPPFPEVFGSAAHYYTPFDARTLAQEIAAAWQLTPAARAAIAARVRARAAHFSWDRNVEELVVVLDRHALPERAVTGARPCVARSSPLRR